MSRYEQRLAAHKAEIRARVLAVGHRVEEAIADAVDGLLSKDRDKCSRIIVGDLAINRELRAVDKLCHAFVARHLPSAGHLRFVSSVLRMDVALERIGDYAVTIARDGVQINSSTPEVVQRELRTFGQHACRTLNKAMAAFADSDPALARETKALIKESDGIFDKVFRELMATEPKPPLEDLFRYLSAFNKLQRVADQAKNICEETLFEVLGETKPPKRYSILFLDARDTLLGPLAVAIAERAFPESGKYVSAGFKPGDEIADELLAHARKAGLDINHKPTSLADNVETLSDHHVIVSLTPDGHRHISEVPFKTAFLQWDLPKLADADGNTASWIREVQRELAAEIQELMIALRGEDAC